MADYWKSQPRKYCDFCKCWIADNKPSRDFHERGKRHQQAIQDKLSELKKKGTRDAKQEKENEEYMAEMEKEAMKKFKQDLAANPELAKQYAGNREVLTSQQKEKMELENTLKDIVKQKQDEPDTGGWQEGFTEEGYVYYWNDKTGESSWYPPGSGKEEGGGIKDKSKEGKGAKKAKLDAKGIQLSTPMTEMHKNNDMSERSRYKNLKKTPKETGVLGSDQSNDVSKNVAKVPINSTGFGSWTPVVRASEEAAFIDIQLPKIKEKVKPVVPSADAFETFEITEKTASMPPLKKNLVRLEMGRGKKEEVKKDLKGDGVKEDLKGDGVKEGLKGDGVKVDLKDGVKGETDVVAVKKRKRNLRAKDEED